MRTAPSAECGMLPSPVEERAGAEQLCTAIKPVLLENGIRLDRITLRLEP